MPLMNHDVQNGKNLTTLLSEMKEELQEFLQTRIALLKTELREKLDILKTAAPLGAGAVLLLTTAYFLFTFALVGLIVVALPDNRYRWFIAFLSIAVLWSLLGGLAAYLAKRELEVKGLTPKRTIEVLKGDKMWVQSEVKNQI